MRTPLENYRSFFTDVRSVQGNADNTLAYMKRSAAGDAHASRVLLEAYRGTVKHLVKRYASVLTGDWEDCFQEGKLAILDAAVNYDIARGHSPMTYIFNRIKWRVLRYIHNHREHVRIPIVRYKNKKLSIWKRHTLTFSELTTEANEDIEQKLGEYFIDDTPLADETLSDEERTQYSISVAHWLLERLRERSDRLYEVMSLRFLGDMKLQEIGDVFGCCRENVRQLEAKAFKFFQAKELGYASPYRVLDGESFDIWLSRMLRMMSASNDVSPE